MARSMFSREVFLKLEEEGNPFLACRALSRRARDINTDRRARPPESPVPDNEPNSSASALLEFAEGRIALHVQEGE